MSFYRKGIYICLNCEVIIWRGIICIGHIELQALETCAITNKCYCKRNAAKL